MGFGTRGGGRVCTRFLASREGSKFLYVICIGGKWFLRGDYSVVELEDDVVVEAMEGNMDVGRVVEDYVVGEVAGTVVDNMVEVLEAFVVDNLGFVELTFVVQC
jgi:hypothetical protein